MEMYFSGEMICEYAIVALHILKIIMSWEEEWYDSNITRKILRSMDFLPNRLRIQSIQISFCCGWHPEKSGNAYSVRGGRVLWSDDRFYRWSLTVRHDPEDTTCNNILYYALEFYWVTNRRWRGDVKAAFFQWQHLGQSPISNVVWKIKDNYYWKKHYNLCSVVGRHRLVDWRATYSVKNWPLETSISNKVSLACRALARLLWAGAIAALIVKTFIGG